MALAASVAMAGAAGTRAAAHTASVKVAKPNGPIVVGGAIVDAHGRHPRPLAVPPGRPEWGALSRDGTRAISLDAGAERPVLWTLPAGPRRSLGAPTDTSLFNLAWQRDGRHVLAFAEGDGDAPNYWVELDTVGGTWTRLHNAPKDAYRGAACDDRRHVATIDHNGLIVVMDAYTGQVLTHFGFYPPETDLGTDLAWLPNCRSILADSITASTSGQPSGAVLVRIDLRTRHTRTLLFADYQFLAFSTSCDGLYTYAIAMDSDGTNLVRSASSGGPTVVVRNDHRADFIDEAQHLDACAGP